METKGSLKPKTRKKTSANKEGCRPKRSKQQPYKLKRGAQLSLSSDSELSSDNEDEDFSQKSASKKTKLKTKPQTDKKIDPSTALTFEEFSQKCKAAQQKLSQKSSKTWPYFVLNELYADTSTFKKITNSLWGCIIRDNSDYYKIELMWEAAIPRLVLRDPQNQGVVLKLIPDYQNLKIESGNLLLSEDKLAKLITLFQSCLGAEGLHVVQFSQKSNDTSSTSDKSENKKHAREETEVKAETETERPLAKKFKTKTGPVKPQIEPEGKEEKAEKASITEIDEKTFIEKIKANLTEPQLKTRLDNVLYNGQIAPPAHTYKVKLTCENAKGAPFAGYLEVEGLFEFRKQKEYGDTSGQGWVMGSMQDLELFCSDYKPVDTPEGMPTFYEFRFWQLDSDEVTVQKNVAEISRGWIFFDKTIGEWHTLHKSEAKTNPLPGTVGARISDHMFSLFCKQGTKIFWADSSHKKDDLYMRFWNKLSRDPTWYVAREEITKSVTCPKVISIAKHRKPIWNKKAGYIEQNPAVVEDCFEKIRSYPLEHLYSIIPEKQQQTLLRIYNVSLNKVAALEAKKEQNPFAKMEINIMQLVIAVNTLCQNNKGCNADKELQDLILDGIDQKKENTYTKNFKLGTALAQFKSWVGEAYWNGYYYEATVQAMPMQVR